MDMLSLLVNQVVQEPTPVKYKQAEPTKVEWTTEMLADIGKMTDAMLAEKYGISRYHVYTKRSGLGIKAVARTQYKTSKYDWPDDEISLFKKYKNNQLSELLGIPYASIQHRRKLIGVEVDLTLTLVDAELTESERAMLEKVREKERRNAEKTARILQMRAQGKTYQQISNLLEVSFGFISNALTKREYMLPLKYASESAGEQVVLDKAIEHLDVINKYIFILKSQGVDTFGVLVKLTKADLLRMPNLGRYAFADIVIALEKHGLKLKVSVVADKQSKAICAKAKLNND